MQTKYELRLESPVDSQARIVSLEAESEDQAREIAEASERDLVNFSLLPPSREEWERGTYIDEDGEGSARVNLANWDAHDKRWANYAAQLPYKEAVRAAERRLDDLALGIDLGPDGKVRRSVLRGRAQARFLAHHQTEPYSIVDVRHVPEEEIERQRIVTALARATHDPDEWEKQLKAMRDSGTPLAAVTAVLFGVPWQKQIDGSSVTVFSSASVQCSLHTGLTAVQDTDDFFNDVSASEIAGTGYSANGVTLSSKASTYDTASDQIRLDAADVSWTTSTLSATDAIIWVNTAGASTTDPVWANIDFGATVSTTAGTFQVTFDSTGIVVFDVT